jgi:hypothetical protein
MITDAYNTFVLAGDTGNTGTRVVGDAIDAIDIRDLGAGQPIYLMVIVDTKITAASTDGKYTVALTTADNDALSTNPVNLIVSPEFDSSADIEAGTVLLHVALPMEGVAYKKFLGVREIVATQNTTAGKISAFLTYDPLAYKAYAQAQN